MLRFKILVLVIPLALAAVVARVELIPGPRPCIAIGNQTVQIASEPWNADLHVSFTDDPAAATIRVGIADSAEIADYAVVDDIDSADDNACAVNAATKLVAVSATRQGSAPVIYLSHGGPVDYRIFVQSKTFTPRDAAALIVGASGAHPRLATASL
jgi:hypothetical protein